MQSFVLANTLVFFSFFLCFRYFSKVGYKLSIPSLDDVPDLNTLQHLDHIKERIMERLRHLPPAPSVPFYERPPDDVSDEDFHVITDDHFQTGLTSSSSGSLMSFQRHPMRMWNGDL